MIWETILTSDNADGSAYTRHGDELRRTYAGIALSAEQQARHKQRLRAAAPRRLWPDFVSAEIAAIAAVTLVVVAAIVTWQSLEPRRDGASEAAVSATARAAALPFPAPETCPADGWSDPENRLGEDYPASLPDRENWASSYYLDGSGITLNTRLGLLFAGTNDVVWLTQTYQPQDTAYTAERLDGASAAATFQFDTPFTATIGDSTDPLNARSGTLSFPSAGCWLITVSAQDASLRKVVYVYPADTRE